MTWEDIKQTNKTQGFSLKERANLHQKPTNQTKTKQETLFYSTEGERIKKHTG